MIIYDTEAGQRGYLLLDLSCFIYTPATQAGTPDTALPPYLGVRTGLRLSEFKNCDKGLVFLFVRVLETQSLIFNHGHTGGKEELVLTQAGLLMTTHVGMQLPDDHVICLLTRALGAEDDLRADGCEGRHVTNRVSDRLAVGGASRCSSSRNISYDGHRHPHRAEGLALLMQPTADRAALQTSAHGLVAAWPGPGRGPLSLCS